MLAGNKRPCLGPCIHAGVWSRPSRHACLRKGHFYWCKRQFSLFRLIQQGSCSCRGADSPAAGPMRLPTQSCVPVLKGMHMHMHTKCPVCSHYCMHMSLGRWAGAS